MFNKKLKAAIILHSGTQVDWAKERAISPSYLSDIIRGRRELPADQQEIWAEALGCEPRELFGNNGRE